MRAESSLPITGVSVSGPGSRQPNSCLTWSGVVSGFAGDFTSAECPPVGTIYTFVVHFPTVRKKLYQDNVKAWVTPGPVISVTPGASNATIHWTDVSTAVPNADLIGYLCRYRRLLAKRPPPAHPNFYRFQCRRHFKRHWLPVNYRAHVFIFDVLTITLSMTMISPCPCRPRRMASR